MDFNKSQIDQIIDDVSYLQDEVEAFKYVISNVPYSEKPAGEESILEMIGLIDHAQKKFYRPFVETAARLSKRPLEYNENFEETFELDEEKYGDPEYLLNKIIKHRAALLSILEKLSALDWNKKAEVRGKERSIFTVMTEMVHFERNQFKKVADRVLAMEKNNQQNA